MNLYAFGFVGVLGLVGLGVDYHQQSAKADLPLGSMSLDQYINTYEARFLGAKAERLAKEREAQRLADWRAGGLTYLPEAPEGWTRRKYNEGSNTAIMPDDVTYYEEMAKTGGAATMMEGMKAKNASKEAGELAQRSWVYERGDEAVFVTLRLKKKVDDKSFGGVIAASMGGFDRYSHRLVRGYQVVGGVGFVELPHYGGGSGLMQALENGGSEFKRAHFRRLVGTVGFNEEIEVSVHANAGTEATMEVLNAIDWDGLNGMLATPMATIGNDVRLAEDRDPAKVAVQMMKVREQFNSLRSQAANFRLINIDQAAMVMNLYTHGKYDLTNGAVPDLGQMIDMGFRKEIRDLMANRPTEGEYLRIKAMMEERPESERDLPKGQMSDELREELSSGFAPVQQRGDAATPDPNASDFALNSGKFGYSDSKAFATVKPEDQLTQHEALFLKHTQSMAEIKGDGPAQQAARLTEMGNGLSPGACLVRHDTGEVACNKKADSIRESRIAAVSPNEDGTTLSKKLSAEKLDEFRRLGGTGIPLALAMLERQQNLAPGSCKLAVARSSIECDVTARAESTASVASAPATTPGKPVTVRRLGAGGKGSRTGNCGAGKFCKAD